MDNSALNSAQMQQFLN
ncbi:hypothetical protein CICLE_v100332301mg, partial [Citrus x clementina]